MENEEDIVRRLENDDFFQCFLNPSLKQTVSQSLTIVEQVTKLGEGIELVTRELHKQVLDKHDDLLRQANHATKLDGVLGTMNLHVQNLFANAERLRNQITVPYNALETQTKVLGRLHLASHILRQVNRIQQLSKRLSNTNDPVQKATILQELEQLAADPDLEDVDAVTTEIRNVRAQQQKVIKLATGSLNQGITNENITQTTTALQIFINLGSIKSITDELLENHLGEIRSSLKSAFDVSPTVSSKSKTGPGKVQLTSSQGFRNKVWTELEKIFSEDIYILCKQVKFLQQTVNSLNVPAGQINMASDFWNKFSSIFQEEILKSSSAIKQTLDDNYPKLLKCYYEMTKKLKYDIFNFRRNVLDKCENSYLSTSLTRMLDPAQSMFTVENKVPTHDQIDSLIRIVQSELSVAIIEENLSEKISKNVAKTVKMFGVKTEQQLDTGPEAAQVIGGSPNAGQQRNVQLANALYYLQTQILRMLSNMKESLPESGANIINESLNNLDLLTGTILQPLVVSLNSVIETIIVTIHLEPDWAKLQLPKNAVPCSPYMRELSQFITRVYHTYLATFKNKQVLLLKCNEIAIRSIELFVRHSSLLKPISQGGRIRLNSDYMHLETSLKVICPHLSDLGQPYRLLKSMATLVTLKPEEIISSQVSGSSVPHSTVLLMLFSFAGNDFASPHQNTGWSLAKLSAWLDEHQKEQDRLDLIAGAFQRYESLVRQKNSENYDPIYPIMSTFLESSIKLYN